jgi:hypothetical protein
MGHFQTSANSVVQRRPKAALILGLSARVDSGASSPRHGLRSGAAERVFPTAGQGSEGSRRAGRLRRWVRSERAHRSSDHRDDFDLGVAVLRLVSEVSRMDNIVDRLTEAIKLYIARLTRGSLDEREGRRAMETVSFAINLSMSAISSTRICAS